MNVFLTGATGFVGGAVAQELVRAGHAVRGLVRDGSRAGELSALGIAPVIGDLDDADVLAREARASDGVIHTASNRHAASVVALLRSLEGSGKPLLHTSGVGLISADVKGDATSEVVVDDLSAVTPAPHPAQQALAALEHSVVTASSSGVRGIVLSNAMIYGNVVGLGKPSVQIALMTDIAVRMQQAGYVGRGVNRWSNVHVDDVAALYRTALERNDARGFYFVESGEAAFVEIAASIARRLGLGVPLSLSLAKVAALVGEMPARFLLGSEARVRSSRAVDELGWHPRQPMLTDWIENIMALPTGFPVQGVPA